MKRSFKVIDASGDVGLIVKGEDIKRLFENAAYGLYFLLAPCIKATSKKELLVELEGTDLENLFVRWLNELIYLFDAKGFLLKEVKMERLSEIELLARLTGCDLSTKEDIENGFLIKAATYHGLVMKKKKNAFLAKVIFDI